MSVRIVHEQDSSLAQVFESLAALESVVYKVFESVVARTSSEKDKLAHLNERVRMMSQQITQVAGHKQQATCIVSPAKFPDAPLESGPLFTQSVRSGIKPSSSAPLQLPPLGPVSKYTPDVSDLFLSLDRNRQAFQENSSFDLGVSSISSLVPFGSKRLPEPLPPKPAKVLGPQPAAMTPVIEPQSFLFPRSHATPPPLGTPTDLPLPKLVWIQPTDSAVVRAPPSGPAVSVTPAIKSAPSVLATPSMSATSSITPPIKVTPSVSPITPLSMPVPTSFSMPTPTSSSAPIPPSISPAVVVVCAAPVAPPFEAVPVEAAAAAPVEASSFEGSVPVAPPFEGCVPVAPSLDLSSAFAAAMARQRETPPQRATPQQAAAPLSGNAFLDELARRAEESERKRAERAKQCEVVEVPRVVAPSWADEALVQRIQEAMRPIRQAVEEDDEWEGEEEL